jgi:hypothetical protein
MGKCESSTASIGLKILLSDLILQINQTNFTLIKEMLHNGFIEDENDYFFAQYARIIGGQTMPNDFLDCKQYLTDNFTNNGSYHVPKVGPATPTLDKGCLLEQYLLVPVKKILAIERWGYDRDGVNASSIPMDFDLSVDIEKYKDIEKTEIVFILEQNSG